MARKKVVTRPKVERAKPSRKGVSKGASKGNHRPGVVSVGDLKRDQREGFEPEFAFNPRERK